MEAAEPYTQATDPLPRVRLLGEEGTRLGEPKRRGLRTPGLRTNAPHSSRPKASTFPKEMPENLLGCPGQCLEKGDVDLEASLAPISSNCGAVQVNLPRRLEWLRMTSEAILCLK